MYLDNEGHYFVKESRNMYQVLYETSDGNIYLIKEYKRYYYACKYASKMNKERNKVIF